VLERCANDGLSIERQQQQRQQQQRRQQQRQEQQGNEVIRTTATTTRQQGQQERQRGGNNGNDEARTRRQQQRLRPTTTTTATTITTTTMAEEAVKKTMVGVNVRLQRQQKFKWIEWSAEDYNSLEEIVGYIKSELKGKEQEGEWHLYKIKGTEKEKIDGINQIVEGQLVELQKEKSAVFPWFYAHSLLFFSQ